jgi:hypothetical protein
MRGRMIDRRVDHPARVRADVETQSHALGVAVGVAPRLVEPEISLSGHGSVLLDAVRVLDERPVAFSVEKVFGDPAPKVLPDQVIAFLAVREMGRVPHLPSPWSDVAEIGGVDQFVVGDNGAFHRSVLPVGVVVSAFCLNDSLDHQHAEPAPLHSTDHTDIANLEIDGLVAFEGNRPTISRMGERQSDLSHLGLCPLSHPGSRFGRHAHGQFECALSEEAGQIHRAAFLAQDRGFGIGLDVVAAARVPQRMLSYEPFGFREGVEPGPEQRNGISVPRGGNPPHAPQLPQRMGDQVKVALHREMWAFIEYDAGHSGLQTGSPASSLQDSAGHVKAALQQPYCESYTLVAA